MTYSHTQISQYLACPRRYRYRYLDGWREREIRPALLFGRTFEKALGAYFRGEDSLAVLHEEWGAYREGSLEYSKNDSWERMLRQGEQFLHRFAQDDRVQVPKPKENLQIRLLRQLTPESEYVAYLDAIGLLDGARCLIDWKTTTSRYTEEPQGLLALDPQLISYSWISGISAVALVVFVRKNVPEIQYLRTTISAAQRADYESLVRNTIQRIESACFLQHSGIRFPQNGCLGCAHLGLCLDQEKLVETKLIRRPEAEDLAWLDQLDC